MPDAQRLRPHPEDRFAAPVQQFDLPATLAALRLEPHHAVAGHRQIAIFRRGPVTVLAFDFEPRGCLKEHRADGVVIIQALSGQLRVTTGDASHDLPEGHLVALEPGVLHSVHALTASSMLLTVCKGPGSGSSAG